jgi:hypothetical protein
MRESESVLAVIPERWMSVPGGRNPRRVLGKRVAFESRQGGSFYEESEPLVMVCPLSQSTFAHAGMRAVLRACGGGCSQRARSRQLCG